MSFINQFKSQSKTVLAAVLFQLLPWALQGNEYFEKLNRSFNTKSGKFGAK